MDKIEKDVIRKITKLEYVFKIPTIENMELILEKKYLKEPFEKELKERQDLMSILEKSSNKDKIYNIINQLYSQNRDFKLKELIFKIFTGNKHFKHIILNNNINNIQKNIKKNKYENIYFSNIKFLKTEQYKNMATNINKYQYDTVKELFEYIKLSYKYLKKNGSCLFEFSLPNKYLINTLYFLTNLFEEIYVLEKYIIFCKNFKNQQNQIENINKIEKNMYKFDIKTKKKENKLITYFKKFIKLNHNYKKELIINLKTNNFILYSYYNDLYLLENIINISLDNNDKLNIKKYLKNIYIKIFLNKLNYIKNNKNINNTIYINEIN